MSIIGLIVFGLIVGIIAKLLMPGRDPGGFIVTILIGIVGSLIGGFLGQMFWPATSADRSAQGPGWIMSIIGAVILLALYRMFFTNRNVV